MDPDNFKSDFPSARLESADLGGPQSKGGRIVTLTIRGIKGEIGDGTDSKPKQVMTFEPQAGIEISPGRPKTEWLYGITVARCLAAMFGDKKSGWIGKRVTIQSELVESFGDMVPALRPIGSPDIDSPVAFSVPKGRGKVKMTMRVMKPRAQALKPTAPSPDEMARAEREAAQ